MMLSKEVWSCKGSISGCGPVKHFTVPVFITDPTFLFPHPAHSYFSLVLLVMKTKQSEPHAHLANIWCLLVQWK